MTLTEKDQRHLTNIVILVGLFTAGLALGEWKAR